MASISPETFDFLTQLKQNNHRDWFLEHKHLYETAHKNVLEFAGSLFDRMSETDNLVEVTAKKMLFRIYRDIRFSKDKSPYKTGFSGRMKRATPYLRGGYYFHISPGNTVVAGGFWKPNAPDMKRIRNEIAADDTEIREIIADPVFKKTFGQLEGDQVKTAPKGFSKDHPAIDLIRYKQFLLRRSFSDKETLSKHFLDMAVETYQAMRPFFDYMSEVLTTDANGVRLKL